MAEGLGVVTEIGLLLDPGALAIDGGGRPAGWVLGGGRFWG